MQAKRTTRALILEAITELVTERNLQQVSVRDIAERAGITTRSFYNYFPDKYAAIGAVYLDAMMPHIETTLTDWNEIRTNYFMKHREMMVHALSYEGQNSIADVIGQLEVSKIEMHIDAEVDRDSFTMKEIERGITYFVDAEIDMLKQLFLHGNSVVTAEEYQQNYANVWDLVRRLMPAVAIEHLRDEPQCAFVMHEL